MIHLRYLVVLALPLAALPSLAAKNKTENREDADLRAAYERANTFQKRAENAAFKLRLEPHWLDDARFWYRNDLADGVSEYVLIDAPSKRRTSPFDKEKLAAGLSKLLSKTIAPLKLKVEILKLNGGTLEFSLDSLPYQCDLTNYLVTRATKPAAVPAHSEPSQTRLNNGQIEARIGETWTPVTKLGGYDSFTPSDDPHKILALHLLPGDHKKLYLLHSTSSNGTNANGGKTRATLEERLYDQPGDQMDRFEPYLIDLSAKTEQKIAVDPILGGSYPWPGPPDVRFWRGQWLIAAIVRGNQEYKIIRIDPKSGSVTTPVDERAATFIDVEHTHLDLLEEADQFLFQSERSGWSRLYRFDARTGAVMNAVTPDLGVYRETLAIDEKKRQLFFMGNGFRSKEDPYQLHAYRSNLDNGATVDLTPNDGTHKVEFSPDRSYYVDTYSRVDQPPVHELRRSSDGTLVMELEHADVARLQKNGVPMPERFVAKGRDGETDIWGVVFKPTNFNPHQHYPIIEDIYAGPHDSFVPKAFQPIFGMQRLAELGFIVVQIDGMGTSNRGKKFHDVCWKNVADAGFPDRILWMQSLAKHIPQIDLKRVGVYGTSAGGQDAANAVLFHPDFYTAAVASCGCYDNRIDKQWWNEQWMGYPVGPHYADQAAVNHVQSLKGHLMLFVGEDDHNVPPESTFQLVDALIKSKKEFDMLVLPGFDHTDGGPYGERKRRDFFVRWLLGKTPPNWNEAP
jgi:dipeptidyl aminopeptidase/acylaminoacyl peptidase